MHYGFLHLNRELINNMIMISKHYIKSENKAFIIKHYNRLHTHSHSYMKILLLLFGFSFCHFIILLFLLILFT